MKCNFLIHQKSQESRSKSSIDAEMNTGNADFWNGKIHSNEAVQSVPQFSLGPGLVDLFLFSKIVSETG